MIDLGGVRGLELSDRYGLRSGNEVRKVASTMRPADDDEENESKADEDDDMDEDEFDVDALADAEIAD